MCTHSECERKVGVRAFSQVLLWCWGSRDAFNAYFRPSRVVPQETRVVVSRFFSLRIRAAQLDPLNQITAGNADDSALIAPQACLKSVIRLAEILPLSELAQTNQRSSPQSSPTPLPCPLRPSQRLDLGEPAGITARLLQ
jgi:hypothetical protein